MTTPADLARYLADIETWESRVAFMYRDSATAGNLTIGLGCLLPDLETAQRLPFWCLDIGEPSPHVATYGDILWDWKRVTSMKPGNRAQFYRSHGTFVYLLDDAIDALANARLAPLMAGLAHLFPAWESLPLGPRRATVDLGWNLGIGGLTKFVKLRAAIAAHNWQGAAAEGVVQGGRKERNAWRAERFLDALVS